MGLTDSAAWELWRVQTLRLSGSLDSPILRLSDSWTPRLANTGAPMLSDSLILKISQTLWLLARGLVSSFVFVFS